jgi:hypothetical protein
MSFFEEQSFFACRTASTILVLQHNDFGLEGHLVVLTYNRQKRYFLGKKSVAINVTL